MTVKASLFWGFVVAAAIIAGVSMLADWPPAAAISLILLAGLGTWVARGPAGQLPHAPDPAPEPGKLAQGLGRALLEQMPAAILVIADTERLTYLNPAAQRLFPGARSGAHFSGLIRAPDFVRAIDTILLDRQEVQVTFGQTGRVFEARAAYVPVDMTAEFGTANHVIVQIEDKTRDKAMLDMRTDFIANASHELRTPLASILGYIETLQGHARDDPDARERFLDIMLKQANRMKRLVDDLMSLSRIELNAHIRPDTVLDLHKLAAEAAAALFPLASDNDVLLQVEVTQSDSGPQVLGDRDQLNQVVVNLIDNAIKYGGAGRKVRVHAALPDPRYPGMAGISVTDEGPGIAREHIPRITERFFRVNTAQSRDKGGTGLGLAIAKHIMARHSGALDIRSKIGEGSTFTLRIPAVESLTQEKNE